MSGPETSTVDPNGFPARIRRKSGGPLPGSFAGFGGLPRWTPFLDRLAERWTVVAQSLPGVHGGDRWHTALDTHLDWLLATRHLLDAAGLEGADLAGSSVAASLAAEVAAVRPRPVGRLALIAPFGFFNEADPPQAPWARRPDAFAALLTADPETWKALKPASDNADADAFEGPSEQTRAGEAAARVSWPLGDTRPARRLPLVKAPTCCSGTNSTGWSRRAARGASPNASAAPPKRTRSPAPRTSPNSTGRTRSHAPCSIG